jgi:hypothetical protein
MLRAMALASLGDAMCEEDPDEAEVPEPLLDPLEPPLGALAELVPESTDTGGGLVPTFFTRGVAARTT